MSKVDKDQEEKIREEAALWLAALDSGSADPVAFEEWRNSSPGHAIAFIRMSQIWRSLDKVGHIDGMSGEDRGSVDSVGAAGFALLDDGDTGPANPQADGNEQSDAQAAPRSPGRRVALKAAAVTAFALVGGKFAYETASARTEETGIGERRRFYAGEHVCVDLDTATTLKWWKSGDGIEMELRRGQILLQVMNGGPACQVYAGSATIMLDNGYYDVRLNPAQSADGAAKGGAVVDLVTIRGAAQLLPRKNAGKGGDNAFISVMPQQRISFADGMTDRPVTLSDHDLHALVAWKEGDLVFDGQMLNEAVAEYNRYLRLPLRLESKDMGRLRLGGRFLANDPDEFIKALHANFGISAGREGNHIVLRK